MNEILRPPFTLGNLREGDWIKYADRGATRITEILSFYGGGGSDRVSALTPDGYVHFGWITEARRSSEPAKPKVAAIRPRRYRR